MSLEIRRKNFYRSTINNLLMIFDFEISFAQKLSGILIYFSQIDSSKNVLFSWGDLVWQFV